MNELIIISILLIFIMILMRKRRQLIDNPEPVQFNQPTNKSVTGDELDRVLMLMQISGSITPMERNEIYIKTLPFTKE